MRIISFCHRFGMSLRIFCATLIIGIFFNAAFAGVTNPNLSVIGQMRTFITDDPDDVNRNRGQISFDETEIAIDDYLNPYARGTFVLSIGEDGIEVEEGYMQLLRGLPGGLTFKAGKYRVGFGKLNPMHPHAYPFIERFRVLAAYLPGEEAYNEIGGQLSYRLPLPGDLSSTVSFDILQGNSFHPDEADQSRPAMLARWSNFFMLNEASSMELGASATQGVNDVSLQAKTSIYGADAKAKLWLSPLDVLVLQAEFLALDRELATFNSNTGIISRTHTKPIGGYFFADYLTQKRYEMGVKYERYQEPDLNGCGTKPWGQSVGLFAGFALMEETTLFRLNWDRFLPTNGDAFNTFTFQILFSMGPHKAHQF
jgi:hypothetical protein